VEGWNEKHKIRRKRNDERVTGKNLGKGNGLVPNLKTTKNTEDQRWEKYYLVSVKRKTN